MLKLNMLRFESRNHIINHNLIYKRLQKIILYSCVISHVTVFTPIHELVGMFVCLFNCVITCFSDPEML